jgi:aminoglycoside phosphotransferase (APT) family kinase protein
MSLAPDLAAWVERRLDGRLEEVERLVSGNSRTTWAARVQRGDEELEIVLRVDAGDGPFSGTPLDLAREARTYAALQGTAVRIPAFYGYDAGHDALALERAPGKPDWNEEVLAALLAELAHLHSLDPEPLDLPGARSAAAELELWARIAAKRIRPPSALVEFALARLREHFPGEPPRAAVLHGDPGVGNLLWHQGEISALLDWEMSHVGDPYDDLAFITVRTAMHLLPLPDYGAAVAGSYFGDPAAALDGERLRYWQAVGVLRNVIICESSVSNRVPGRDQLVQRLLLPSVNRMLIGLLAELEGVELPPPPIPGPPPRLPGAETLDEVAAELSAILPGIEDPELHQRGRRVRYLLSQFAETWPLAAELAAAAAAEGPAATDPAERLWQLARAADREIALFPRAATMAYTPPPGF